MNASSEKEIREFVIQNYLQILERDPDPSGLSYYVNQIKSGKISHNELVSIILESDEYKELKEKKSLVKKINKNLEEILLSKEDFKFNPKDELVPEPSSIIVSCHDRSTGSGGLFFLNNDKLEVIYNKQACFGIFYDQTHEIILSVTESKPQIIAFKLQKNKGFSPVKINFSNYVFAKGPHSISIFNDKLYVVASDGEANSETSTNILGSHNKVGKIIVSEINFKNEHIEIKNSKIFNPFSCSHHHHINDLCENNGNLYISSFSYCDSTNNYVENGIISKLDPVDCTANVLFTKLDQPHSPFFFNDRCYVCSSGIAAILSFDIKNNLPRLEYKGIDAYTRGLLVTNSFFYLGISFSLGRTNSKFANPTFGILRFDRKTGETKHIPIPEYCDNVYGIIGIN